MVAIVEAPKCVGCSACVSECPVEAIVMNDGKAFVKADLCVDCGACVGACPVEAITQA